MQDKTYPEKISQMLSKTEEYLKYDIKQSNDLDNSDNIRIHRQIDLSIRDISNIDNIYNTMDIDSFKNTKFYHIYKSLVYEINTYYGNEKYNMCAFDFKYDPCSLVNFECSYIMVLENYNFRYCTSMIVFIAELKEKEIL